MKKLMKMSGFLMMAFIMINCSKDDAPPAITNLDFTITVGDDPLSVSVTPSANGAETFQIYFDFSGYSDMAIGMAKIIGLNFPSNFRSPLKEVSIINFWRSWHITLTRFTTGYIFNPITIYFSKFSYLKKNYFINCER